MSKYIKIIFLSCFVLANVFFTYPTATKAKTLKDIYNELNELQEDINATAAEKQLTQSEINNANNEVKKVAEEITKVGEDIIKAQDEIKKLNKDIEEKQKETKEIIKQFQISQGESEHLEYIFGAKDITDFIHRNAVVERLTTYNKELVEQMNSWIEEQKQLQIDLANKEESLAKKQKELRELLAKLGKKQEALEEQYLSIAEEIKSTNDMIKLYESLGTCGLDDDINVCARNIIPPDTAFWRPLDRGYVTSEWGWRIHPTKNTKSFHSGIDLGNGGNTGAPVYASANGKVSHIIYRSSCGGNMVFINHNIKGKSYTTAYLHLHAINVKLKENVTKNTVIGTVGGGESYDKCTTGPHLHFSVMQGITASLSGSDNPRGYINLPAGKYNYFYNRTTRY
ncbi:MAG: peptidoglycan DD-metalloendopeptidase family protein [Bacilli bacterium]